MKWAEEVLGPEDSTCEQSATFDAVNLHVVPWDLVPRLGEALKEALKVCLREEAWGNLNPWKKEPRRLL